MTRRAARTDENHAAIRDALREVGCIVQDTHALGGFCDLVVVTPGGRVLLLEVKSPGGTFTPDEVELILRLVNPCYRVAVSVEQAIQIVRGEG